MKSRFGIRVIATYEEAAHRELRPGDSFIKVDVSRIYRLHPLPHGPWTSETTGGAASQRLALASKATSALKRIRGKQFLGGWGFF